MDGCLVQCKAWDAANINDDDEFVLDSWNKIIVQQTSFIEGISALKIRICMCRTVLKSEMIILVFNCNNTAPMTTVRLRKHAKNSGVGSITSLFTTSTWQTCSPMQIVSAQ